MAALQRHVVVSGPPEPACRGAVFWQSNAFSARSSSQSERRFASLALPYPLCLTMPATLSPTVMYLRDDRRGNHTHLATQLLQPLFDFSAPFFLVDMPDVVRLIGKNEICHCAGSFHGQCLSGQLSSPPGVGHALGRDNELKRRGRPWGRVISRAGACDFECEPAERCTSGA